MKKKIMKVNLIFIAIIAMVGGLLGIDKSFALNPIKSLPDTIKSNTPNGWNTSNTGFAVNSYTASNGGTTFDVYCLEHSKEYAANLSFGKQEAISDYGLLVIMANSYPNVKFTYNGKVLDEKYQKWITQTAIWYYLGQLSEEEIAKVQAAKNVSSENELTNEDNIPLYNEFIKPLVELGNSNKTAPNISIDAAISNNDFTKSSDGTYYESGLITVTGVPAANFNNYSVSITAPNNTKVFAEDGTEITNLNNISTNTKFYLRVYDQELNDNNKNINIKITGNFDIYEGYYYRVAGNDSAQTISTVNTQGKELTKELNLEVNQIVEVPDTNSNSAYLIAGLLITLIGTTLVIKTKINN